MTFTIKKIEIIVMMASALAVSVPTWADEEIVPLIECAVQEKYERKSTCLGTGNLNDPARDPQVYFHNKCTTKIAVKQCFSFPNGTVVDSTETIKPSQTKRLFTCTKKAIPMYQDQTWSLYPLNIMFGIQRLILAININATS